MWTITSLDVINLGRSPGGDRFTGFVDALIHAQRYTCGVSLAAVHTNLRTNIPDGGVDTKVDVPFKDDPTGWLTFKSIWQYRATDFKSVTPQVLKNEVSKHYARQCISEGYAYRFCICDELPPREKVKRESELMKWARQISPDTPQAKVLGAGDLAGWANQFPALSYASSALA